MSKQVTVTFDFDETLGTVSNLKCVMDGIEKKKKVINTFFTILILNF